MNKSNSSFSQSPPDHILIGNTRIPIQVVSKRGDRISLQFSTDRDKLIVKVPGGRLNERALNFILHKEKWILKHYRRMREMNSQEAAFYKRVAAGEVLLRGKWIPFRRELATKGQVIYDPDEGVILRYTDKDIPQHDKYLLFSGIFVLAKNNLPNITYALALETDSHIGHIRVKKSKKPAGEVVANAAISTSIGACFCCRQSYVAT